MSNFTGDCGDPRCLVCRHHPECTCERCRRPNLVQIQEEAWAKIAEEEREGKRQPPVIKWSARDLYMERIFHAF